MNNIFTIFNIYIIVFKYLFILVIIINIFKLISNIYR